MLIRFVCSIHSPPNHQITRFLYHCLINSNQVNSTSPDVRNMSKDDNKETASKGGAEPEEDPTAFYQVRKQKVNIVRPVIKFIFLCNYSLRVVHSK